MAVTKFNSEVDQSQKKGVLFVHRGTFLDPRTTWLETSGYAVLDMLLEEGFDVVTFDLRGTKARFLGDGPSKQEFFTMQVIIFSSFIFLVMTFLTFGLARQPRSVFITLREPF